MRTGPLAALLKTVLAARYLVVAAALAALVFCGFLLLSTGRELIPPIESPQFTIYVRMPTGTNIDETERQIKQIEQVIIDRIGEPDPAYALGPENEQISESNLQLLISNLGVLMDWPAAYTPNTGPMDAFMLVQLKGKRGMDGAFDYVAELRESLNERFPDVEFAFDTGGMMTAALNMGEPSPIHFQIAASNLERAQKIAGIIKGEAVRSRVRTMCGSPNASTIRRCMLRSTVHPQHNKV